jgi:hypothetical protein
LNVNGTGVAVNLLAPDEVGKSVLIVLSNAAAEALLIFGILSDIFGLLLDSDAISKGDELCIGEKLKSKVLNSLYSSVLLLFF